MADLTNITKGYRVGEALPIKLQTNQIIDAAKALNYVKNVTPSQLTDRILLEGRGDAGVNEFNTQNKIAKQLYDAIVASGGSDKTATTAAAIVDKQMVAQRLGMSFDRAWNGAGKSIYGSGQDYVNRAKTFQDASKDPKNADLLDLVSKAATGSLTPQQKLLKTLTDSDFNSIVAQLYGAPDNSKSTYNEYLGWTMASGTNINKNADLLLRTVFEGLKKDAKDSDAIQSLQKSPSGLDIQEADIIGMLRQKTTKSMGVNVPYGSDTQQQEMLKANPELDKVLDSMTTNITSYLNRGQSK